MLHSLRQCGKVSVAERGKLRESPESDIVTEILNLKLPKKYTPVRTGTDLPLNGPSWEETSREIAPVLWNPKYYCVVYESPRLDLILSEMSPGLIMIACLSESHCSPIPHAYSDGRGFVYLPATGPRLLPSTFFTTYHLMQLYCY